MQTSSYSDVIKALQRLDLSTYPYEQVRSLLQSLMQIGFLVAECNGLKITRARIGNNFSEISEVSYNPSPLDYPQRANLPNTSVFYGSVSDDDTQARFVSACECSAIIRDTAPMQREMITYAKWEVVKPMVFVIIIDKSIKINNCELLRDLQTKYAQYLSKIKEGSAYDDIMRYLTTEFSKVVTNEAKYEYLISATLSSIMLNTEGYDGIIYPSVASCKQGLNLAIKCSSVDSKLKLTRLSECEIKRNEFGVNVTPIRRGFAQEDKIIWNN